MFCQGRHPLPSLQPAVQRWSRNGWSPLGTTGGNWKFYIIWIHLVGGLEHFLVFPYVGNNHTNSLSYVSEGWPNHQLVIFRPSLKHFFLGGCFHRCPMVMSSVTSCKVVGVGGPFRAFFSPKKMQWNQRFFGPLHFTVKSFWLLYVFGLSLDTPFYTWFWTII